MKAANLAGAVLGAILKVVFGLDECSDEDENSKRASCQ